MDVLLVNPNSRKGDSVEELPLLTPPLNLMYVAQNLEEKGFKTSIIDSLALNLKPDELLRQVKKNTPEMVGFPLYSSDLTSIYLLTNKLKEQNEDIKIFFAGHHVSSLPDEVMRQFPQVDYLIKGEGEFTTPNLLNALNENKSLDKIKGISFRKGKKVYHNLEASPTSNLDEIPIPSRKFINPRLYYSRMSKRSKVDILITARGCPYKCTFCAKLTDEFRGYRERSIPNIIEELKLIGESGTNAVEIYDEIFTLRKKRVLDLVKAITKEKMDFEFRIRTRVTHVDKDILHGLKDVGCSTISYGVESGNQQILNNIQKGTTIPTIEQAFLETEKAGINALGFFMIGNRGETPKTIYDTINFAKKLNPLYATFGVLHPYPGTVDFNSAKKEGTLQGEYAPFKPQPWIKLPWTNSVEQLYEYSEKAYTQFYKRPAYISKFLRSTLSQGNWNLLLYTAKNFYTKLSRINPI